MQHQGGSETTESSLSIGELKARLITSEAGLSAEEALRRLEQHGYNELADKRPNPLWKFLSYFWGPIPWMIEAAVVLSALVRHWADFFIIFALLWVNAAVGFWEEFQAGNTVAALKANLALKARVKRDGVWKTAPAREIVPGDYLRLRLGEIIPADVKLVGADPVEVDQSALTGESLPAERRAGDTCYSGSILRRGETEAFVYATGRSTYFGKTVQLVQEARTESHLQRAVLKIGNYLILVALALVTVILAVSLARGESLPTILQFSLILTVASIPVAMPTVMSVTMAVGARLLARKQAIVTKLSSTEELAGMDVLCTDKTGTLTQNKLALGEPFTAAGADRAGLLLDAALASRAEDEDPIDQTILGGIENPEALKSFKVTHFLPFDPVRKRTEAAVTAPDGRAFAVTKGAPQVILALAEPADDVRTAAEAAIARFASKGFRSLAVARRNAEGEAWKLSGIIPLFDPPREDSKETIRTAREMGIRVKMLTGDQAVIAQEIARELGMGSNITEAPSLEALQGEATGDLMETLDRSDGFAQVFPEHKYRIVETLQKRGYIVGMTGDGVNDAPALKKADVGIAVSGASDAARAAAAIVLLSPGLSVIVDAVQESRRIFQRMTYYAVYRIAETIRVLLFMTLSILVFNFYPVTAIMIVLLAILNDGAILSIAYDRTPYYNHPEKWNLTAVLWVATALGVVGVAASFGLFLIGERVLGLGRDVIQSLIYLKLSVAGHMTIFVTRTRGPFWSHRPSPILSAAILATQIIATLITVYGVFMTPIGWRWAALVWAYALVWFFINDVVKLAMYRWLDRRQEGLTTGGARESAERAAGA